MFARFVFALLLATGAASAAAPGWSTYTDAKNGFAMDYPSDWKVNPDWQDKGYGFFQGDTDDVHPGIAFTPTTNLVPGSVLQSDQLVLAIEAPRIGAKCNAAGFLVDPPPDYFTQVRIDKPDLVDTTAQAGDLYTIEHIVILARQSPCVAVHYVIVSARSGGTPLDREGLINFLNKITGTLRPVK
ncbi:MAG TPA: hypothetical protein VG387_17750 [Rhizomicrobium sp.]|jgi:hypothetical protein|nr:hypothetical protein [Rhizomicrobium sp.]